MSCSFDLKVILWDLDRENYIVEVFEHPEVPSQVCFNPNYNESFVSVCVDQVVRLWNTNLLANNNKKNAKYILKEKTA